MVHEAGTFSFRMLSWLQMIGLQVMMHEVFQMQTDDDEQSLLLLLLPVIVTICNCCNCYSFTFRILCV